MLEQCLNAVTTSNGVALSLFIAGLAGSVTHCTTMCSPFILAQMPESGGVQKPFLKRLSGSALLPYHTGRITTYIILGIIFSSTLNLVYLFSPLKPLIAAPLLILAGIMFLTSAFPKAILLFPFATKIKLPVPFSFISAAFRKISPDMSGTNRFLTGMILGLMPCGLVISALMATASTGNPFTAGIGMFAFGVGTIPALFCIAAGGNFFKNLFPGAGIRLKQGFMLGSALWLFILAGQAIF